jgi:stage IV sporulation protein B
MSGSPIVQNNRLVGAVTHVFTNDPLKGFGIYADWMFAASEIAAAPYSVSSTGGQYQAAA